MRPLNPLACDFLDDNPSGDRSREELKREWEDFKKKREQQEAESSIAIKGLYQCRVDATEPLRRGEGRGALQADAGEREGPGAA